MEEFFDRHILPAEALYATQVRELDSPWETPEIVEELKRKAHAEGLWNLFLPDREHGAGLTNLSTRRCAR